MRHIKSYTEFFNSSIKESYEDVIKNPDMGMNYIKNKIKKLDQYPESLQRKKIGDIVLINEPPSTPYDDMGKIHAFDVNDGTEIGNSSYGYTSKRSTTLKATIDVRPDWRRRGVATEIYKFIEEITGDKLWPDYPHSPSAEKFWKQSNRPFGEKDI
jgi:hypothetical protein